MYKKKILERPFGRSAGFWALRPLGQGSGPEPRALRAWPVWCPRFRSIARWSGPRMTNLFRVQELMREKTGTVSDLVVTRRLRVAMAVLGAAEPLKAATA